MSFRPPRPLTARWRPVGADGTGASRSPPRGRRRIVADSVVIGNRGGVPYGLRYRLGLRRGLGDAEPRHRHHRRPQPAPPLRWRRRVDRRRGLAGGPSRRLHRRRPRRFALHQHASHPPRRACRRRRGGRVPHGAMFRSTRSSRWSTGSATAASKPDRLYRYEAVDRVLHRRPDGRRRRAGHRLSEDCSPAFQMPRAITP